jgi:hypothetical protein
MLSNSMVNTWSCPNAQVPDIQSNFGQLKRTYLELGQLHKKFMADLSAKFGEIEKVMVDSSEEVAKQERWWESTNIFNGSMSIPRREMTRMLTCSETSASQLRPLQDRNPPNSLDYADYIREKMYVIWQENCPREFDLDWFLELFDEEILRVLEMGYTPESWRAAFDLHVLQKIDILQAPTQTVIDQEILLTHHSKTDKYLDEMLDNRRHHHGASNYGNAAKACRSVRERMYRNSCEARENTECVFNTLLPALNTLQERAHKEVVSTAWQAVGYKLPVELAEMVVEYALIAEEVPSDPRIFVFAKHERFNETCHKTRLVCEHSVQWKESAIGLHENPFGLEKTGIPGRRVWGPKWVELKEQNQQ